MQARDSNGELLERWGAPDRGTARARAIALHGDGLLVVGSLVGELGLDADEQGSRGTSRSDGMLVEVGPDAVPRRARLFSAGDLGPAVEIGAVVGGADVIIAGETAGPVLLVDEVFVPRGDVDCFVAVLSPGFDEVRWSRSIGAPAGRCRVAGLRRSESGHVVAATVEPAADGRQVRISRWTSDGTLSWSKGIASGRSLDVADLAVDSQGYILVTGVLEARAAIGGILLGPGADTEDPPPQVWVTRIAPEGDVRDVNSVPAPGDSRPVAVAAGPQGVAVVGGGEAPWIAGLGVRGESLWTAAIDGGSESGAARVEGELLVVAADGEPGSDAGRLRVFDLRGRRAP